MDAFILQAFAIILPHKLIYTNAWIAKKNNLCYITSIFHDASAKLSELFIYILRRLSLIKAMYSIDLVVHWAIMLICFHIFRLSNTVGNGKRVFESSLLETEVDMLDEKQF